MSDETPDTIDESEFVSLLESETPDEPKTGRRGRKPGSKSTRNNKAQMAVTVLLRWGLYMFSAIVPAWGFQEEEVKGISEPGTRLILRHVPLARKLNEDALDVLAIMGVLGMYTKRVSAEQKTAKQAHKTQAQNGAVPREARGYVPPTEPGIITPDMLPNMDPITD